MSLSIARLQKQQFQWPLSS